MNVETLWNDFLNNISNKVANISFNTWFKDTRLVKIIDSTITISTNHEAVKTHLESSYYEVIEETFLELTGKNYNIEFVLESELNDKIEEEVKETTKTDKTNLRLNTLNKKYNFENFIVGETNKVAYLAAVAVAEKPGKLYNPLFIYGKSGLGKTHLMNAIGNFAEENLNKRVLYITAENFVEDFISISKKYRDDKNIDYMELFKKKYRDVDLLMIDDIQFLSSATKSQQEFTNTFNSLYHNDKQIIICSDRSVKDLQLLEERLKTRFNWGLTVNIYPPDIELKKEILKKKIKLQEIAINIPEDVISFIASSCGSDVRNLEGALTSLCAYSAIMNNSNITLDFAMEALKDYTDHLLYSTNSIEKIQMQVAEYFKITVDDLKGKKRSNAIAHPRAIAMYLSRILTDETYPRIGLEFGGKDHSTVIYAYEKISKELKNNPELEKIITEIKNNII